MVVRFLVGLLVTTALLAPAVAKDCGRLPKGKNPAIPELNAEMSKLSATHNVPTEVIKAVAHQESGCQQWRANGTFVYNKTDCGLGMMQLTGATARQFDVERLKDDWKYNLECGVKVLVAKWKRAERKKQVPTDPEARRVLENWYYAIAYYWGGKSEKYLRKIFAHMKKRPGKLAQLMGRPVEVTLPSEVIKGFKFGDTFTALRDNQLRDKNGKVWKVPTHLGTIGDPKTLAALDVWLARGEKAAKRRKTRTALKYLLKILQVGLDTEHRTKAEALLAPLLADAEEGFKEASAKAEAGDKRGARKILRKLAREWKGHEVGTRAKQAIEQLKAKG